MNYHVEVNGVEWMPSKTADPHAAYTQAQYLCGEFSTDLVEVIETNGGERGVWWANDTVADSQAAQEAPQGRRKRFKARIVYMTYVDLEVLAHDAEEARAALGHLSEIHSVCGSDYVEQQDCMLLVGQVEIDNPEVPAWGIPEDYPGDLQVKNGDYIVPEAEEYYCTREWKYKKRYPQRS